MRIVTDVKQRILNFSEKTTTIFSTACLVMLNATLN